MNNITWLHISDLHFQESPPYDNTIIIESLLEDIKSQIKEKSLKVDFIIISGDIANKGLPEEYHKASQFLEELREISNVPRKNMFVVPGNHDVSRALYPTITNGVRMQLTDKDSVNDFLAGIEKDIIIERFYTYYKFMDQYLGNDNYFTENDLFFSKRFKVSDYNLAVLGLNTSWVSTKQNEQSKLLLGEKQVRDALKGIKDVDFKLAVLHHPFDWLCRFDRISAGELLLDYCDFILHGHLHEQGITMQISPDYQAVTIAAGACYNGRDYPNSYNFVSINPETEEGKIYLRKYNIEKYGFWVDDNTTYRRVSDGIYKFSLPKRERRVSLTKARKEKTQEEPTESIARQSERVNPERLSVSSESEQIATIDKLSEIINLDNILRTKLPDDESDPIRPIKAIIIRSLKNLDEGSARYGLRSMSTKIVDILTAKPSHDQIDNLSKIVLFHYSLIGGLIINNEDIYASLNIFESMKSVGDHAAINKYAKFSIEIIDAIREIGENGIEHKLGKVAYYSSNAIISIGKSIADQGNANDNMAQSVTVNLRKLAIRSLENKLNVELSHITTNIGQIGLSYAKKEFRAGSYSAVESLGRIASECTKHKERDAAIIAETYIQNIGVLAARKRLYNAVTQAGQSSAAIIDNAAKHDFLEIVGRLVGAISVIGEEFIVNLQPTDDKESYGGVCSEIIRNISKIVEILARQDGFDKRQEFLYKFAADLGKYGRVSAERGLASPASQAAVSYIKFGSLINRETVKKYLKSILEASNDAHTCVLVARSFNELGNNFRDLNFRIEAEEAAKKAISIDPQKTMAYLQLQHALAVQSTILFNSGDKQNAQKKSDEANEASAKYKELIESEK